MNIIDWSILAASLVFIVVYGLLKGRGQKNLKDYILAGNQSPWYVVAFSIMATQASAITFLSTPGQGYVDGLGFVQIYFGLPIAMVILCVTLVPMYHKLKVYTAYEFLEKRLDLKTRILTSGLFLLQRGLAAGFTVYAPALILSVILGWKIHITTTLMGVLVILYTLMGGSKAVGKTQFLQMLIALFGMVIAFGVIVRLLPGDITFLDAVHVAGKSGHLEAIDFSFDLNNRYTIWSGILGGLFLSLSYFGTDQSQVQRYLGGSSIGESRIGLLFNAIIKIPMQFFILFVGVMMFVFYQFNTPPVFFNKVQETSVLSSNRAEEYKSIQAKHQSISLEKKKHTYALIESMHAGDDQLVNANQAKISLLRDSSKIIRKEALAVLKTQNPKMSENDTNYIFLSFVTKYLPVGVLGIVLAMIFAAAMSSVASELSALSSTTLVDVYKRLMNKNATEAHYLLMSRVFTFLWGLYAILTAQLASKMGSLIEAVNIVGSLFYGTILGIFALAFYFKRMDGTSAFIGALISESVVVICYIVTDIGFLWYNLLGTLGTILFAILIQGITGGSRKIINTT